MPMRNSLTFTPDFANNRVEVRLGNAGGAHAMFLSLSDVLTLEEWIANARHDMRPVALTITQGEAPTENTEAPSLLWLVCRAHAIRSAKGWTKAERDRSWSAWDKYYADALAREGVR